MNEFWLGWQYFIEQICSKYDINKKNINIWLSMTKDIIKQQHPTEYITMKVR